MGQNDGYIVLYLSCIYPSGVKPVVINCNDNNLLQDLMLHKLSMINFIKFLLRSLVTCEGMAFLGDIMLHYARDGHTTCLIKSKV